jgi:Mor family transcriptional regulator
MNGWTGDEWIDEVTEDMLPSAHRKLCEVIGLKATLKLCAMWGGSAPYIPTLDAVLDAVRQKHIRQEFAQGRTTGEISRRYGTTERTVQRLVKDMRPEQISIWDEDYKSGAK